MNNAQRLAKQVEQLAERIDAATSREANEEEVIRLLDPQALEGLSPEELVNRYMQAVRLTQ